MKWIFVFAIVITLLAPMSARAEGRCLQQGGGDCSNRQEIPACRDNPGGGCVTPNGRYVRRGDAADWRESANEQPNSPYQGEIERGRQRPR